MILISINIIIITIIIIMITITIYASIQRDFFRPFGPRQTDGPARPREQSRSLALPRTCQILRPISILRFWISEGLTQAESNN